MATFWPRSAPPSTMRSKTVSRPRMNIHTGAACFPHWRKNPEYRETPSVREVNKKSQNSQIVHPLQSDRYVNLYKRIHKLLSSLCDLIFFPHAQQELLRNSWIEDSRKGREFRNQGCCVGMNIHAFPLLRKYPDCRESRIVREAKKKSRNANIWQFDWYINV